MSDDNAKDGVHRVAAIKLSDFIVAGAQVFSLLFHVLPYEG